MLLEKRDQPVLSLEEALRRLRHAVLQRRLGDRHRRVDGPLGGDQLLPLPVASRGAILEVAKCGLLVVVGARPLAGLRRLTRAASHGGGEWWLGAALGLSRAAAEFCAALLSRYMGWESRVGSEGGGQQSDLS